MNQRELYIALGAKSETDILRHFPNRYEDLRPTLIPETPEDGQRIVAKGKVSGLHSINKGHTSIIRFRLMTFSGKVLPCMIYNQPFYITKVSSDKELLAVLYYSEPRKTFMVQSLFDLDSYYVMTGMRPVYTLPKSVSNYYFTSMIKKMLSYPMEDEMMKSIIPQRLIDKYRFMNQLDAYRCIHLPKNEKDLKEGLRVFKYEEALSYSVNALMLKSKADRSKKYSSSKIDHQKINTFVKNLSYKLTKDQLSAIHEIVTDMEKDTIMYRLLQGDVGTGKTIVAFTALYANYLRGNQGLLVAPTFELSRQHYQNALKVFDSYGIKCCFLSGNGMTASEKRRVLEEMKNGVGNILISTHAAISDSVKFKELGLTIIDEQQRFGVEQRERLLEKGDINDLLMMSATPIPRTLSQVINADMDVSTLSEFPHGIRDVHSAVVTSQDPLIHRAIDRALASERQIFVVAPRIEKQGDKDTTLSAESIYQDLTERYGVDNVQLLHGRLRKEEQDRIIKDFAEGKKLILVSTTVIEVGIDVSMAALLIVYEANYFGLSSLHQLRGRIGRSGLFALALFVYDGKDKDAKEKLDFLVKSNDGLRISEFDLRQRGSGSYSGTSQSGSSELKVCNFVEDLAMFQYAKADAINILNNPNDPENKEYLSKLKKEKILLS